MLKTNSAMHGASLCVKILSAVALLALSSPDTTGAEPRQPPGFLEVENISQDAGPKGPTFNSGRPYCISINQKLPESAAARDRLIAQLHQGKQLDQFVFEWFGSEAPKRLNLAIGKNVPVEAAQAAIAAYAVDSKLPVYLRGMHKDEAFGNTHRIYIGGLVDDGTKPTPANRLKAALKPGITGEELMNLLPETAD